MSMSEMAWMTNSVAESNMIPIGTLCINERLPPPAHANNVAELDLQ